MVGSAEGNEVANGAERAELRNVPTSSSFLLKLLAWPLRGAVMGCLLAAALPAFGQQARFFRVVGPTAATITAFRPDGALVWGDAQPGATYIVQTATGLPGGTNWVDYVQLPVNQAVNTNFIFDFNPPSGMALIPAGSFTMGNYLVNGSSITNDPDLTDAKPTNVTVSAFHLDVNLVSYSFWQPVYTYATNHGYGFDYSGAGKTPNEPVQTVNWYDCVKWCNARSQQAGRTPVYYTDAGMTQVYTNGDTDVVYPNWSGHGYRLPTEAEWEKAARGGLVGRRFPWGDFISEDLANYDGNTSGYGYDLGPNGLNAAFATGGEPDTSPVESFAPNGYGLCDMAGNLYEWCWDWYDAPYAGGSDPRGPASPGPAGPARVLRGGYWANYADQLRCANRINHVPVSAYYSFGFRCVRGL